MAGRMGGRAHQGRLQRRRTARWIGDPRVGMRCGAHNEGGREPPGWVTASGRNHGLSRREEAEAQ
jgi:hypothetical protein